MPVLDGRVLALHVYRLAVVQRVLLHTQLPHVSRR
jgi:hypothetical protein